MNETIKTMVLQTTSRGVGSRKNKSNKKHKLLGENSEYQNLILIELPDQSGKGSSKSSTQPCSGMVKNKIKKCKGLAVQRH